jgi:hypothetical protein
MDPNGALGCLEAKWRDYLEKRGHRVCRVSYPFAALTSRNRRKQRYRWLLMSAEGSQLGLDESCRAGIRYHLGQAKGRQETTYLVAGFLREPRRIVVVPANTALRARCIRSSKGGIAWDD